MRDQPSAELIDLLDRLGLASQQQIRSAARHARRLAQDLPLFDSVWVDALVAARLLTPYQASQINAGQGASLAVSDYVLLEPTVSLGWADCFRARETDTRRTVCLLLADHWQGDEATVSRQLKTIVPNQAMLDAESCPIVEATGFDQGRAWAVTQQPEGISAADWMLRNGRFPPQVVLEIARQTAHSMAALEQFNLVHGNPCAAGLFFSQEGFVQLPLAEIRGTLRPEEGYAFAELVPDAYDYLAPERVAQGTGPTTASDVYACGALWWHLLTGRGPLAGGNGLVKLKAAQAAKIPDVRRHAPETPAPLAAAISACTQAEVSRRSESFAQLAATLGPSTAEGRRELAKAVAAGHGRRMPLSSVAESVRHWQHLPVGLAALAGCLLMLTAMTWPMWRSNVSLPLASIWSQTESSSSESDELSKDLPKPEEHETVPGSQRPLPLFADSLAASELEVTAGGTDLQVLPEGPINAATLELQPNQIVRPAPGKRGQVVIGALPLTIQVEGVSFENIDFVVQESSAEQGGESNASSAALIQLLASGAEFIGCSFQSEVGIGGARVAIAWTWKPDTDTTVSDALPEVGQLRLSDCVLRRVAAGVHCRSDHSLAVELSNTLHLGPGPMLDIGSTIAKDKQIEVTLNRCTLRQAASLVDVAMATATDTPPSLSIEANDCVLAPQPGGCLLRCFAGEQPERLWKAILWSGTGTLLPGDTQFALWYDAEGEPHQVEDRELAIQGIVASDFQFSGDADAGAAASEIKNWSAPLRSEHPPGVRAPSLSFPVE